MSSDRLGEKANQAAEAFSKLRQAIIEGELQPNQRLVESRLARKLGTSRTPVREALRELLIKGYLSRLRTGGLIVIDQSPSHIRNLYEVREALETKAITLACQRITPGQIKRAYSYHIQYSKAVNRREIDQSIELNAAFHDELLAGCENKQLLSILGTIRDQYLDRRVLLRFTARNWQAIVNQHGRMLEAVRCRNAHLGRKAVRDHLKTFNRVALERL